MWSTWPKPWIINPYVESQGPYCVGTWTPRGMVLESSRGPNDCGSGYILESTAFGALFGVGRPYLR